MKIGVFGGSFDPIHLGHLIIAQYVLEKENLDKIIFIPVGKPCHREDNLLSNELRYEMLKVAIKDNPKFEISDIEMKADKTSYTIDTFRELKKIYLNDDLYEIIGEDSAVYIDTWKEIDELVKIAKFLVLKRPGYNYEGKYNLTLIDSPEIQISATEIRDRIKIGKDIKYFVTDEVLKFIKSNNLYKEEM